jgi:hypothetical protein
MTSRVEHRQVTTQCRPTIAPVRVHFLDRSAFPGALPILNPLLADNGRLDILMHLVPDQLFAIVAVGKAVPEHMVVVLPGHGDLGADDFQLPGVIPAKAGIHRGIRQRAMGNEPPQDGFRPSPGSRRWR